MSSNGGGSPSPGEEEMPFYLMPLAAVLGMYSFITTVRILYIMIRNLTKKTPKSNAEKAAALRSSDVMAMKSGSFLMLVLSLAISVVGYAFIVGKVEKANLESQVFDPYDILLIPTSSNSTEIKSAYRALSKTHHPDKGGDQNTFQRIHLAYRALTDETSRENWEKYGHPDGPPSSPTLNFALPEWLLHPQGVTAVVLIVLYLGMFALLIKFVVGFMKKTEAEASQMFVNTSVDQGDISFLREKLLGETSEDDNDDDDKDDDKKKSTETKPPHPLPSHTDILYYVATTPENLQMTRQILQKQQEKRDQKIKALAERKKEEEAAKKNNASSKSDSFDLDEGGWADDDDDEEQDEAAKAAALAAKKHEEEKRIAAKQLAMSTGKLPAEDIFMIQMEGIDDGVLGQKWVEGTLEKNKVWPPKEFTKAMTGCTFRDAKGQPISDPLSDPAIRRNVLYTTARLHSQLLNSHPELVAAGPKGMIDQLYFKSSMEYRQRNGLLLEAALRLAISEKNYKLTKRVIESVAMFKIGTATFDGEADLKWFRSVVERQYGGEEGFPRLIIQEKELETPGEDEIATGDSSALNLTMVRGHAQKFFESKLESCKKQGVDPRLALQSYHEGWWVLIRSQRVGDLKQPAEGDEDASNKTVEKKEEPKFLAAWPFIVRGIAQQAGKVNCRFKAPDVPGRYKFLVDLKSQDFLGADNSFEMECDVLDQETVTRKEQESGDEDEDGEESGGDGEDDDDEDDAEDESKKDQ